MAEEVKKKVKKRGKRGRRKSEGGGVEGGEEKHEDLVQSALPPLAFSSDGNGHRSAQAAIEAPFGYLDVALKTYLKALEPKLVEARRELVADDEATLLLQAALGEIRGQELVIATDPDGSVIIQRIIKLLDERQRRIFADTLVGSVLTLAKHRFGSHVLQDVIQAMGRAGPAIPSEEDTAERGVLRSAEQLARALGEEVTDQATFLVSEQFGTHGLRTLITTLCPISALESTLAERSEKSRKFTKTVGIDENQDEDQDRAVEGSGGWKIDLLGKLVSSIQRTTGQVEISAWATHPSASLTLQYLLEAESYLVQNGVMATSTLLNHVLSRSTDSQPPGHSAIVEGLLRDTVGSRTLQVALRLTKPIPTALESFYQTYLAGRLLKFACQPVAFYIVNEFMGLLDQTSLDLWNKCWTELKPGLVRLIKSGRPSVLRALLQASMNCPLDLTESDDVKMSILSLFGEGEEDPDLPANLVTLQLKSGRNEVNGSEEIEQRSPSIHGSLLLQALFDYPNIERLAKTFATMDPSKLKEMATDSKSSHVFDAFFASRTISKSTCRQCILALSSEWTHLARHNVGSKVLEKMWSKADIALRERMARSLTQNQGRIEGESGTLAHDFYGKMISKNFDLATFQKRVGAWREKQIEALRSDRVAASGVATNVVSVKHKDGPEVSEIDDLFKGRQAKRVRV